MDWKLLTTSAVMKRDTKKHRVFICWMTTVKSYALWKDCQGQCPSLAYYRLQSPTASTVEYTGVHAKLDIPVSIIYSGGWKKKKNETLYFIFI